MKHQNRLSYRPRFDIYVNVANISHVYAKEVLAILQGLKKKARLTTPALLLAEAIERLHVNAVLTLREPRFAGRAAANVEAFLERAQPYGVRGLKCFVRDVIRDWEAGAACNEGEQDSDEDAIKLITVHSAKGLEWPVVIPINTATGRRPPDAYVHRISDDTLHWVLGNVAPPDLAPALAEDDHHSRLEQERLWYVACTRARELLLLPHIADADGRSWAKLIDLKFDDFADSQSDRIAEAACAGRP